MLSISPLAHLKHPPLQDDTDRFLIVKVRIGLRNKDNLYQVKPHRIKFAIGWNRIV